MIKFSKYKLLLSFVICIFILYALSGFKQKSLSTNDANKNYQQYCAGCHGKQLEKFIGKEWIYGSSWNEVFKSIKTGYPNDGMPTYDVTFSNKEISDLTTFILTNIEKESTKHLSNKSSLSGIIQSKDLRFRLDTVVSGIDVPWGIDFLPNNDMLITERSGVLYRLGSQDKYLKKISGTPVVKARGQGGLLDIQVDPYFSENSTIYLSFSKPHPKDNSLATTAIISATLKQNQLTEIKEIFSALPYLPTTLHYGSRMEIDNQNYLYISVGDRGRRDDNPQYLNNHCGKIHRIHKDGSIPKDNPFVHISEAKHSIFSYGHRNPQGLAIHPTTKKIWQHEHGPRGGDEVNIIKKGLNYGWPIISYGINYNGTIFTKLTKRKGMQAPELYWVPSIAPCGMDFVKHRRYKNWNGDLLVGSLRFKYLKRCIIKDDQIIGQENLLENIGRVREVKSSPNGYIYIAIEQPGHIIRLVPTN